MAAKCLAVRIFRADGVPPLRGVGTGCDAGPFSVGWSPLASAGAVTAVLLRWITLWSYVRCICAAQSSPKKAPHEWFVGDCATVAGAPCLATSLSVRCSGIE